MAKATKKGLGTGLGALLGSDTIAESSSKPSTPKRKLWDRDTEISNCLITSSSLSEDVDSSSSSPKLLTGSKQEP